jgi:hypothetical protein
MIIRDTQFEALQSETQATAEKELVEHCREYAPRLFQAAGEAGVREAVRLGLKRSKAYGFTDHPQVRFYIDMMLVLGSDFDTDPQYPWASETLQDSYSKPHVRGMVLHRDLSLYLDRVLGPQKEHVTEALNRLVSLPRELPPPDRRGGGNLRHWVSRLYPQKSQDVDDKQLARIAEAAAMEAAGFGIPAGDAILGSVMLILGHGATRDPLYPWISGALRDPMITSPEGRLDRLYSRLRVYAEHARNHLVQA